MSRFTYKGVDLSPFLNILKIERTIGNERGISTNDAPKIGVNVQEVAFGAKIIKVKVSLASRDMTAMGFVDTIEYPTSNNTNLNKIREQVTSFLHAEREYKLELPDEPDRYYMAIPSGDIELDGISDWYDETNIEFIVPDGVSHSISYMQFDAPKVYDDKIVFDLVNNGNVDAFPIVDIKNKSENGYVGIVNATGALEIGDIEEVDAVKVTQSEILFDYRGGYISTGLHTSSKNVAILNDRSQFLNGTLSIENVWDRSHIVLSDRGGTNGNNGASASWDIPADSSGSVGSLNDYIWWRQIFWHGAPNQYGFLKVMVSDTDGNFLYGVETFKRSQGLGCEYNILASDGKGGYNIIKQWNFTGTHYDEHNPFNQNRGFSDIKRNNNRLTAYWFGSYQEFVIPELLNKKSSKIHVALGAIGNNPLVSHMYLDGIMYRKDFVNALNDVPNRYSSDDKIVINSENDTVTVNGVEKINDVVHGSTFLTIPPGTSQLEIYCSSWLKSKPEVSIKFEERYL